MGMTKFHALRGSLGNSLIKSLGNVVVIVLAILLAVPLHAAWHSAVNGHMLGKRLPPLALATAAVAASPQTGPAGIAEGAGGVILLDFWAPGCAPCLERVPLLNALHAAYRAQGLTVIGMARATAREGEGAKGLVVPQRVPFAYAVGSDPGGGLFDRMGVRTLPYAVLVDRNGIVVWQGDPSRLTRTTIEATLRAPRLGTLTRF
jgi:thiol-disulfide isomerase/thioredoxin